MTPTTLVDLYTHAIRSWPDRPLFGTRGTDGWTWISYRDFGKRIDRARAGLAALGVEPGESVAVLADNEVEWAALCYATAGLGAVLVPLYPAQEPADQAFVLADAQVVVALAATADLARAVLGMDLPDLRHVVSLEPGEGVRTWDSVRDGAEAAQTVTVEESATATLIYTSGTTGTPKGVALSHRNLCSQVTALQEVFSLTNETSLSFLPWAHSFGQTCELHAGLFMGNRIAINDRIPNLLRNLREVQPTLLVAVPRVYHRIHEAVRTRIAQSAGPVRGLFDLGLGAARRQVRGEAPGPFERVALCAVERWLFPQIRETLGGRLHTAISGSASLNPRVAELLVALGIHVFEGYGLTECSPIAATNRPGAVKLGSVGQALPGVTLTIETSRASESEDEGEIVIHGPNVMQGYRGQSPDRSRVLTEDGGLRTGDLGRIDHDGFLWITGRLTEQFKLENGRFVVPAPLEAALTASPYIAHCLVFGANRSHPVAVIDPDLDAIQAWARDQGLQSVDPQTNDRVLALLADEIERLTARFKPWERPVGFAVAHSPFSPANGLLTPTQKVRRSKVLSRYQSAIEELYLRDSQVPDAPP